MNHEELLFLSTATKDAREHLGDAIVWLVERFARRAESISAGRHRITFIFPKYVIKLPRCCNGVADNDWEGSIFNEFPDNIQYARTRMHYYNGIPIVFMERVQPTCVKTIRKLYGGKIPDWIYSVDCCQVGVNRAGKLVAYDYGRY